jgi:caffeoyl-CoA O-methyltransferase
MSRTTLAITDHLQEYLLSVTPAPPPTALRLREETAKLPNGAMQISIEQGNLMQLLVRLLGARRTLEVGTFTGYSALSVALSLPDDGKIVACDVSEEWTAVGRPFWEEAGVAGKIDLRIGPAADTLQKLLDDRQAGTFDFAFIDADKSNYDRYYELALQLVRTGGLIGVDNTLWYGKVADDSVQDDDTVALRALNQKLTRDPRVAYSLVPIGDGFSLAVKL